MIITKELNIANHHEYDMEEFVLERLERSDFPEEKNVGYTTAYNMISKRWAAEKLGLDIIQHFDADSSPESYALLDYLIEYCSGGIGTLIKGYSKVEHPSEGSFSFF